MKSSMKKSNQYVVRVCLVTGVLGAVGSAGGCYKEVVSKKGLTVDAHHPRKARSSETKIDKAIDDVIREIED